MTDMTIRWAAYRLATSLMRNYGFSYAMEELEVRWKLLGDHPHLHQVYRLADMFVLAYENGKKYSSHIKD